MMDIDAIENGGKRWHGEDHRVVSVRWEPYKPDGQRQMKAKGRWQECQVSGDFHRWQNCDRPTGLRAEALPAVQVGVKPLEWEERGTDFWRALGTDRVYEIVALADGRFFLTIGPRLSDFQTLEAAKAAAQSDYEARIRSALTGQPAPVQAPEVAALVEAGQRLHDMLHMKNGAHDGLTRDQVQALWDSAKDSDGFAAVIDFLTAVAALAALEGRE